MTIDASAFRRRLIAACAGGSVLLLAACSEKELILPGKREDLRDLPETLAPQTAVNESRAIRLASQSNNASWAQPFGTESDRVAHPALGAAPQLVWSASVGAGDSRKLRITADPVIGGGRIYTLDSGAQVSAFSPDGGLLWRVDLTPPNERQGEATGGGISFADGGLYVSLGFGRLVALDASNGTVRWDQKLDGTGSGTPTVRDGLVYLVAGDDTGWAVRTSDGRVAWQVTASPSVANILGAPAPVLVDGLVVFAFGSGDLVSAFRKGGLRRWSSNVSGGQIGSAASRIGDITGAPVVAGNRLYAGNAAGRTVAIDTGNGDRIWTAREGALGPVWPAGDSIFAVTEQSRLVRFDAADGSVIWATDLPGFVRDKPRKRGAVFAHYGPVLAGGRVVVASNDGLLRFFSPEDGALLGSTEVPGGATTGPVFANGTLYVVSARGQLHAFR